MIKTLSLSCLTLLTLTACGKKDTTTVPPTVPPTANTPSAQTPANSTAPKAGAVDQSSPKALAESIFAAARSGDLASLKGIASADSDGDAKNVAGVAEAAAERQAEFKQYFGPGKVEGEVKVEGDKAEVPIKFGPGAEKPETLMMVKVNGLWYLQSF